MTAVSEQEQVEGNRLARTPAVKAGYFLSPLNTLSDSQPRIPFPALRRSG